MSDLPNKPKNVNPKNPKIPLVRDQTGKFVKNNEDLPIADQIISSSFGKENQPNYEDVYLQEAERTKELKDQLAELEKEAEVKEIKGEIEIPEIVKNQGVEQVGEETPISAQSNVTLPLDDTKIFSIMKKIKYLHQNVRDSVTWLGVWCWRQLLLAHVKLKEVHGKVIRQNN